MDPNSTSSRSQERGTSRGRQGGGVADRVGNQAVNRESDVKKDAGPAVSNTYVADNMTVTNNYNF